MHVLVIYGAPVCCSIRFYLLHIGVGRNPSMDGATKRRGGRKTAEADRSTYYSMCFLFLLRYIRTLRVYLYYLFSEFRVNINAGFSPQLLVMMWGLPRF